ncbi:MAG: DUF456 domain-containing protein [Nostocoides sp.]
MTTPGTIAAILIVIGLFGIVVPILPGLVIIVIGVAVWAISTASTTAWAALTVAVIVYAVGLATQYLIPGRRLRAEGVANWTLVLAMAVAIVGFFVIPVIGAPLGFVLAIYLLEAAHSQSHRQAWQRTTAALRAVLTSMGIELLAGLTIAATFVVALLAS